ncbi:MAG: hypothetical protein HYV96_17640 [Opitutae bacterium]|nr:hypothetical protein [Opitutae bacterium]
MSSLLRYDVLVPAGVCLIVLGIALRSANASLKRRLASERQDQQLSGARTAAPRPLTHWERHAGAYARAAIGLGVLATLAGFFRR